jgi:DNA repair photolyase
MSNKAIYKPKGAAKEYSEWACNFHIGCSNGCEYCYCKKGRGAAVLGGDKPTLKKCFKDENNALEIFEKELKANLTELQKSSLFFSFTTDPMLDECLELTWKAMLMAMENSVPVKVLTKVAGKWIDNIIEHMHDSWKQYLAIGFTLTGHDELESNASRNYDRVAAMRDLHNAGFKTWASIEPIIDFQSSKNMIWMAIDYCDLYKVGLMSGKKYDVVEAQSFVEWLNGLEGPKIYLKESLQKLTGYSNTEFDDYFVERDYNIFK